MKRILLLLSTAVFSLTLLAQPPVYNWVPQTLSPGNNLQELTVLTDNSMLIAGYNNSVFKSDDNGLNWYNLHVADATYDFTSLSISASGTGFLSSRYAKLVDFKKGSDVYVEGRLLKTNDFGLSWTIMDISSIGSSEEILNPNKTGTYMRDLFTVECVDANKAYIYAGWKDINTGTAADFGAVFETLDGGATWAAITENLGGNVITAIQTSGANTYIGGNNILLMKSGETVTDLYPALTSVNTDEKIYIFDLDVVSESEFYVVSSTDGIFHSNNAGTSFTKLTGGGAPTGGNDLKVIDANTIMVLGTAARSKVSVDGGTTWTACYPGVSCWEIAGVMNDSVIATAKDNLYKIAVADLATDPTKWVAQVITDLGENIQQLSIIDSDKAILAGYGEIVKTTSDKGLSWTDVTLPELYVPGDANAEYEIDFKGACTAGGVSYINSRRFYFVDYPASSNKVDLYFPGLIYMSKDNWQTWELLDLSGIGLENEADPVKNPFNTNCYGFEPYVVDCVTDSILLLWGQWIDTTAGYAGKVTHSALFRSTNKGNTWSIVSEDMGSLFVTDIQFIDKDLVYVSGNKTLLKSTDGGLTFTGLYETLDPGQAESMFINGLVVESADEIYLPTTADGVWLTTDGGTSFTKIPGLPGASDFIKISDTHMLSLGTAAKSFFTWNAAETWEACSPGVSVWNIGGIVNDSVYALTKGDIYKIAVAELLNKGVAVEEVKEKNDVKIGYYYDRIQVSLEDKLIDRCIVYSISGQIMRSLAPKATSCEFNPSDFAPGIYFISTYSENKLYINKVMF